MLELAQQIVAMASDLGAEYVEGRIVEQSQQVIAGADGNVGINEIEHRGVGIRVLLDGRWGFAATGDLKKRGLGGAVKQAIAIAKTKPRQSRVAALAPSQASKGTYETACQRNPFEMALQEKVDLVETLMATMAASSPTVIRTRARLDFRRERSFLITSEGVQQSQTLYTSGFGLWVVVDNGGQVFQRSYPERLGDYGSGGLEYILALEPLQVAQQLAPEAVELTQAPSCENEETTVILDSTMLGHALHETIGHPSELDRALGDESDNFGPSFLRPHLRGNLQYGSELVTIYADATRPGAVATYGYDHEGVAAQKFALVENGIFKDYLMSRESAATLGLGSNGTARASSWDRIPMVRITNLCLAPGNSTREQLISETDRGIYIETAKGADIDDKRLSFSFIGERGWQIRHGKIVGLVKNPVIYGETPTFWNHCSGIAGASEDRIPGIAGCGKGLPWQHIATGQGGPPARFDRVKVGRV